MASEQYPVDPVDPVALADTRVPLQIDLPAALRAGTRRAHDRIEAALALDRLDPPDRLDTPVDGRPAAARYGRVLQAFALFHRHWQPRVRAALPGALRPWIDDLPRQAWLAADLAGLGLATPPDDTPDPTRDLVLADAISALGSLYVIEGSALGGQVIVRGLARQAPELASAAGRYFHGSGEHTGARWRRFGRVMAEAVAPGDPAAAAVARAVRAADATFEALLRAARIQGATVGAADPGAT